MHLLEVHKRELQEFVGENIPPYAILSHTWGRYEVSFQDIMDMNYKGLKNPTFYIYYAKIDACCRQAILDGFDFVWIDTCCIDKKSSAELSEAINSMFKWYHQAAVCYAYLEDVPPEDDIYQIDSAFRRSRWFTRGWTLQELIAPKKLIFFDRTWTMIFEEVHTPTWYSLVSSITGIRPTCISSDLKSAPVAEKLSWLSRRYTTRVEDMAYCLLGLLDVNMPLMYGEGHKAFLRLQEEFLKKNDDPSILCWGFRMTPLEIEKITAHFPHSPLATSPYLFRGWENVSLQRNHKSPQRPSRTTWTLTPHGLHMELQILPVDTQNNVYLGIIDFFSLRHRCVEYVGISLARDKSSDTYRRVLGCIPFSRNASTIQLKPGKPKWETIYLARVDEYRETFNTTPAEFRLVDINQLQEKGFVVDTLYPPIAYVDGGHVMVTSGSLGIIDLVLVLCRENKDALYLRVTYSKRRKPFKSWYWRETERYETLMNWSESYYERRSAIEVWDACRRPRYTIFRELPQLNWRESITIFSRKESDVRPRGRIVSRWEPCAWKRLWCVIEVEMS